MNVVRVNAYAKLNLTLDVTGRENGYHMLDSLVTTVDVYDRIVLRARKDSLVRVEMRGGTFIPPEENNALRAGEAFVASFGVRGADITVYKNIPVGAGMGGSSADAAGVIAGMAKLYGIADMAAIKGLADTLGSDTGYLVTGGGARLRGRGERVEPLSLPAMNFLVLCPRTGVSSAECFRAFDTLGLKGGSRTEEAARLILAGELEWAAKLFGNDLYAAARTLSPAVEEALLEAKSFSPLGAGMTGSGSAAFALFETAELCAWAASRYRGNCRALCVRSVEPAKRRSIGNPFALSEEEG